MPWKSRRRPVGGRDGVVVAMGPSPPGLLRGLWHVGTSPYSENLLNGGLLTTVAGTGAAAGRRRPRQAASQAGLVGAWSTTPASSAPARPTGQASRAPGAAPAATAP